MSTSDYRRRIEEEIAAARGDGPEPGLEGFGVRGTDDTARLRALIEDRDAPLEQRLAALSGLTEAHPDLETVHEHILPRLADDSEDPAVRSAALHALKAAAFTSPTRADWRPAYIEALRSASRADDEELRLEAFEVLAAERDLPSQDALLAGLEDPDAALVAPEHALRLLADDPHTRVRETARALADGSDDQAVRLEAMRVLSDDPESVGRFRDRLLDDAEDPAVRQLAATALGNLQPEALRAAATYLEPAVGEAVPFAAEDPVRTHVEMVLKHLGGGD